MNTYILAIDQGTSGTKAVIFAEDGTMVVKHAEPLKSYYPQTGFVEQNPLEIYNNVLEAAKRCYLKFRQKHSKSDHEIVSCGISNQRETFVLWDENGKPLYNAVVWQCKRSTSICKELEERELESLINTRTGLTIDPYFSATKVIWLYRNNPKVKKAIDSGNAHFGTIDTWILYKLTDHKNYMTDHTNAARTLFYNIFDLKWDDDLLDAFHLKDLNLPEVSSSSNHYGTSDFENIFPNPLAVTGMIGDSHAAFFGEECFDPNMAKATLGTGSSILWNAGSQLKSVKGSILTTMGWSTKTDIAYAYEGVIVSCGATVEWLKNQLGVFSEHEEIEPMAQSLPNNEGVYLIPSFSGMGAPHWQSSWKASIHGITFGTKKEHLVRAALESIAYQMKDVINAIEEEKNVSLKELKVDGGMTANTFLMQYMANLLGKTIVNIGIADVSAYGAALIAGIGAGVWKNVDSLPKISPQNIKTYKPKSDDPKLEFYTAWCRLINEKQS